MSCRICQLCMVLVCYIFYLLPSLLPPHPLPFPPPSPLPFPLSPPSLPLPSPSFSSSSSTLLPLPSPLYPPPLYLYLPFPPPSLYPPPLSPLPSSRLLQELSLCQQVHQDADVYVLRYEPHLARYPDFRFRGFVHKVCHCHMYNCSLNCFNLYSIVREVCGTPLTLVCIRKHTVHCSSVFFFKSV